MIIALSKNLPKQSYILHTGRFITNAAAIPIKIGRRTLNASPKNFTASSGFTAAASSNVAQIIITLCFRSTTAHPFDLPYYILIKKSFGYSQKFKGTEQQTRYPFIFFTFQQECREHEPLEAFREYNSSLHPSHCPVCCRFRRLREVQTA